MTTDQLPTALLPESSDPDRPTRSPRKEKTRRRLVQAAREVFEEKGFLDTRIADIPARAGLAHGTFYVHFQTKEEIFYEVADGLVQEQFSETSIPPDFDGSQKERFAHSIRTYLSSISASAAISRNIEQVATFDPHMREVRRKTRRVFHARNQRVIERLQREGRADPDISADIVAEAMVSMVSNYAYMNIALADPDDGGTVDIEAATYTLTEIWARSIGLDAT